jgi:hypothetical protein
MAKTYAWVVSAMDSAPTEDGLAKVVKTIHWRRNAVEVDGEKTYYADVYGAMGCSSPNPEDFTQYDDITKDEVEAWLEAGLDVESLDAALDAQIENQKNPPIVQYGLPWVPAPVVVEPIVEDSSSL